MDRPFAAPAAGEMVAGDDVRSGAVPPPAETVVVERHHDGRATARLDLPPAAMLLARSDVA